MSGSAAPPRRPDSPAQAPRASGPAVDPRIRARRADVLRAHARRRLRLSLIVLALVLLAVGAWLLLHSKVFSARVVTVVGSTHTPSAAVVAAAGLSGAPPLLDVSPGQAAAGVERLPWVARAVVSLEWPDGVRIAVTERRPVAAVSVAPGSSAAPTSSATPSTTSPSTTSPSTTTGAWALVDATGRVLADTSAVPAGLLSVVLPTAPGAPGTTLHDARPALKVVSALPAAFSAQVTQVTESTSGDLTLQLTSPVSVELGSSLDLHKKFEDVAAVLAGASLHAGAVIDVAAPDAPVIVG